MLSSEKVAIAAHLHVLLRRKTGRVTDTEWMASNADYAKEIVRFARARAQEDGHADLAEWADKLALAVLPAAPLAPTAAPRPLTSMGFFRNPTPAPATPLEAQNSKFPQEEPNNLLRYVNGIR